MFEGASFMLAGVAASIDRLNRAYAGKWQAREGCNAIIVDTREEARQWLLNQGVEPTEDNLFQMPYVTM